MASPIIEVKNVSKSYRITHAKGRYTALRDILSFVIKHPIKTLLHRANRILGRTTKEVFWALKDVNFTINKGEVVGVIGRNGAGKSTLLKILTKITPPTEGEIRMTGKVASLLEVGTGFHPELTGRENIFLNGAILGMTRREIADKFDSIVEFSGIGQFIDTPVKRYSSGMYVRLAFSVAAHLEPDILLIDEVLAVGDAEFQRKCLGKMEEVTNKDGRTILFVSHNMSAIQKICSKCILLEKGRVTIFGETKQAIEQYLKDQYNEKDRGSNLNLPLTIKNVTLNEFIVTQNNIKTEHLDCDKSFNIEIQFETTEKLTQFRAGIYIRDSMGDILFRSLISDWHPELEELERGKYKSVLQFPEKLLRPGNYFISLHISRYGIINYLARQTIERIVTVVPSAHYNQAHPTEKPDSLLMLKNEWSLIRDVTE
ncbi:MAG: ATP-binding cassette domain-containing protein [Candidatus Vogelbacteria bacterium]|nr:ATP-binding cassette domain-containing protein [Candidatus Vogelbacteria bacterium]